MVILIHTSQIINGEMFSRNVVAYGQMGVQMFFIASAFTLCFSMDLRRSKNEPLYNFYIRRYFRIAPGYYVGIAIFFLINILCNFFEVKNFWPSSTDPVNILVNVLFLNGLYPPANNSVVPGGWSIGTEMLFYLIFPVIFIIYRKLQNYRVMNYLIPVVILMISALIQYTFFKITNNPAFITNNSFVYFSILNQLPVFCVGISMYFLFRQGIFNNIKSQISLALFIVLSCLSGYLMILGNDFFTLTFAITPFISAISFVFLFIYLQNKRSANKTLEKIGTLSYSGYLLHLIFAYFLSGYLAEILDFIQSDILFVLLYIITVTLTFLSANLMYKYIEQKGIKIGKRVILLLNQKRQSAFNIETKNVKK